MTPATLLPEIDAERIARDLPVSHDEVAEALSRHMLLATEQVMRRLTEKHTALRIGNGQMRDKSAEKLVHIYNGGDMPITQIADNVGLSIPTVMEILNADYRCEGCDRPADMGLGSKSYILADGDQDRPVWGTACCGAYFINRAGNPYTEDPRGWEDC